MQRRTTLKDIAVKVGVDRSTVSLALKNDPRINIKTRELIRRMAEELNYVPDPHLSALNHYRYRKTNHPMTSVIGFLVDEPLESKFQYPLSKELFLGAQNTAARFGYKLDLIALNELRVSSKRLSDILHARGIQGIIIGHFLGASRTATNLQWERFAAVVLGITIPIPQIHQVTHDYYFGMKRMLQELRARGYRRPALIISHRHHKRNDEAWASVFLMEQHFAPDEEKGPLLITPPGQKIELYPMIFRNWWNALSVKPDALIFVDPLASKLFLDGMKWRYPKDIGLAVLSKSSAFDNFSGILNNWYEIGAEATQTLINLLNNHELGIPNQPHTLLVKGKWMDGSTLKET